MPSDLASLHRAADSEVTISNKIRALAKIGASRREIADFVGRSYQQVRQVLVEDERRRGAGRSGRPPGQPDHPPVQPSQDRAEPPPFGGAFRANVDANGRLILPEAALSALGLSGHSVVIGRIEEGEVTLIGAERAMRRAQALVRSLVPESASLADQLVADRRLERDG